MNGRQAKILRREARQSVGPAILEALQGHATTIRACGTKINELERRIASLESDRASTLADARDAVHKGADWFATAPIEDQSGE